MQTREYISDMQDFRRGTISGIQDRKRKKPTWVRRSRNVLGRPLGSLATRPGSRDLSSATLSVPPHSLLKFNHASTPKLFVGADDDIYEVTASAYTLQTIPGTPTDADWSHENINGIMVATQRGGSQLPITYDNTSWKELKLPVPGNTMTLTPAVDGAPANGGLTLAQTYFYRLRWIFNNGSSLASTPQSVTLAGAQNRVNITTIPNAGGGRSDLIGWRLERTEGNATVSGPYYFVADGTGTTYDDTYSDSNLGYRADNGMHGEPVHFDGVTKFSNRLVGWSGSTLYISQEPGDLEATGVANFDPELVRVVDKDDGDSIQVCVPVGDELLVLKRRSVHRMLGNSPESFQILSVLSGASARGAEAGAVGPRAACTLGGACYFWGEGGLFKYSGGQVKPAGVVEIGDEIDDINLGTRDRVVMVNQVGDYLLAFFPKNPSDKNDTCAVFDARFEQWFLFDGWRARDAIVSKDDSFGGATLIFLDDTVSAGSSSYSGAPIFCLWYDSRGTPTQFYVQRLNDGGSAAWAANGVSATASTASYSPTETTSASLVPRGDGGCIQVAFERRAGGYGIWAHRLDAAGAQQWSGSTGVEIRAPSGSAQIGEVTACSDGLEGAIIMWTDSISGQNRQYAQRIDSTGTVLWTPGGVLLGNDGASTNDDNSRIYPDGNGGAYCIWLGTVAGAKKLYAQRVTAAAGAVQFGAGALNLGDHYGFGNILPAGCIASDGSLIVALETTGTTVVAKKISATGVVTWTTANLNPGAVASHDICVVADDEGGAYIFFRAGTGGVGSDLYCQRVDSSGNTVFPAMFMVEENLPGAFAYNQHETWAVEDGLGGAYVVWQEPQAVAPREIYAQGVSKTGQFAWSSAVRVSTDGAGTLTCTGWTGIATDGDNGLIVFYQRGVGISSTVRASRVARSGVVAWNVEVRSDLNGSSIPQIAAYTGAAEGEYVEEGSPGFHVWAGFDGTRDFRDVNGLYGQDIAWSIETPAIDDADQLGKASNQPKEYGRVRAYFDCDPNTFSCSIVVEPSGRTVALSLPVGDTGASWADDLVSADDDLVWDEGDWAGDRIRPVTSAFPIGTIGERYRMSFSGATATGMKFEGYELDCVLQPERRADQ